MKIKTALKLHFILVKMAIVKKINDNQCWRGCVAKRKPYSVVGM